MTTRYESFLPEVLPYVPDCPEQVAINAVRNACIEFCDSTDYWLYDPAPQSVVAGTNNYQVVTPAYTELARIVDAWHNNVRLVPFGADQISNLYWREDWRAHTGTPMFYTQADVDEVLLVPMPQVAVTNGLKLTLALKPSTDSVDVDDRLYAQWREEISFGARARLYSMSNFAFGNAAESLKYQSMFRAAIGRARIARNKGLTRAAQYMRPPGFF